MAGSNEPLTIKRKIYIESADQVRPHHAVTNGPVNYVLMVREVSPSGGASLFDWDLSIGKRALASLPSEKYKTNTHQRLVQLNHSYADVTLVDVTNNLLEATSLDKRGFLPGVLEVLSITDQTKALAIMHLKQRSDPRYIHGRFAEIVGGSEPGDRNKESFHYHLMLSLSEQELLGLINITPRNGSLREPKAKGNRTLEEGIDRNFLRMHMVLHTGDYANL